MAATLRRGSKGAEVKRLQQALKAAGFDPGPIDGIFGPKTDAAVRAYQKAKGLVVDGIVGPKTWGALEGGAPTQSGQPTTGGGKSSATATGKSQVNAGNLESYVRKHFPLLAPYLDEPELKNLLLQAARERWSMDMFAAKLRGTSYWKRRTQGQLDWSTLSPAEQKLRINDTLSTMANYTMQLYGTAQFNKSFGSLSGFKKKYGEWAKKLASGAGSYESFQLAMLLKARRTGGTQEFVDEQARQEDLATRAKRPQEIAEKLWRTARGDYFVSISKEAAKSWAQNIINGKSSYGEFYDNIRAQAVRLYPAFAQSIQNGILPKDLFSPALNTLSDELEMSPEAIIGNNALWGEIVSQASGTKGMFTASDWISYARALPEWRKTQKANEMIGGFSERLLQTFGGM